MQSVLNFMYIVVSLECYVMTKKFKRYHVREVWQVMLFKCNLTEADLGEPPPYFWTKAEALMAEANFFYPPPLHPTYLKVWIHHCLSRITGTFVVVDPIKG